MVGAQVTGMFCSVLAGMSPDVTEFRLTIDNLNQFMRQRRIPQALRWRLREYFHKTRHLQVEAANTVRGKHLSLQS